MKPALWLRSYTVLVKVDLLMRFRSLESIHSFVRKLTSSSRRPTSTRSAEAICHAIDVASAFYVKPVLCLQRSVAGVILLRHYGWEAQLCIGAQVIPFKSHAWIELDGVVVNDKPYMREIYHVLECC